MNTDKVESRGNTSALKYSDITKAIIGAFYDVYNEIGAGPSGICLSRSCRPGSRGAWAEGRAERPVTVTFHKTTVGVFRTDLLVSDLVIVALKCARNLDSSDEAQLLNMLKATEFEVGLLLNFGNRPQFRRMLLATDRKQAPRSSP